jgi:hypothetical protein
MYMYSKVDFLESHLDLFLKTLGAVSDEHRERFHYDSYRMDERYQGKWSPRMMYDYCWTITRDVPQGKI